MLFPRIGRKLVVEYGSLLKIDTIDPGKSDTNRYETIANKVLAEISRI